MKLYKLLLSIVVVCIICIPASSQAVRIIGTAIETDGSMNGLPSGVCTGTQTITLQRGQTLGVGSESGGIYLGIGPTENSNIGILYVGALRVLAPTTNNQFILYSYDALNVGSGPTSSLTINSADDNPDITQVGINSFLASFYNKNTKKVVNVGRNDANAASLCTISPCVHFRTYSGLSLVEDTFGFGGTGFNNVNARTYDDTYTFIAGTLGVTESIIRVESSSMSSFTSASTGSASPSFGFTNDSTYVYGTDQINTIKRFVKTSLARTDYTTTFTAEVALRYLDYDSVCNCLIIPVENSTVNNTIQGVLASNPAAAPVVSNTTSFASTQRVKRVFVDIVNNKVYVIIVRSTDGRLQVARLTRSTLALEQLYTSSYVGGAVVEANFADVDINHQKLYVPFNGVSGSSIPNYFEQLSLCS
jgi:hypothetical protein